MQQSLDSIEALIKELVREVRKLRTDGNEACPSCGGADEVMDASVCGEPTTHACGACGASWHLVGDPVTVKVKEA